MKKFFLNCKIFVSMWTYFSSIFSKLLCFIQKRKISTQSQSQTILPLSSIQIQGEKTLEEIKLVDWNTWDDEQSQVEGKDVTEIPAEDLFRDMEPVINKPKLVHVKKKIKVPPSKTSSTQSPFAFHTRNTNTSSSRMNFNAQYQVESELGAWEDEPSGWDDEIDDNEIEKQTDHIIKQTRQFEREKRAEEQKRKRLEKEQLRAQKKQDTHIGVKIS